MLFDTKFDLVMSIGEDCACSSYLRRFVLQEYSYPFDWLTKSDFKSRIELLISDFNGFLDKNYLYEIPKPQHLRTDKKCSYYADKKFDFYYYHDFSSEIPFDDAYKSVKEKYERRIDRMYKKISISNKVLFVWWCRYKDVRQNPLQVEELYDKLCDKFGENKIFLLIIEYSEKEENIYLKNNHILISRFDNVTPYSNSAKDEVLGNIKNNNKIFSQIYKNHSLCWIIKYVIFKISKFIIGLIPVKSIRQKAREDLKFKFDRAKL